MDHDDYKKRLGKFSLTYDQVYGHTDWMLALATKLGIFPITVTQDSTELIIHFIAYGAAFDPIEIDEQVPTYKFLYTFTEDDSVVDVTCARDVTVDRPW